MTQHNSINLKLSDSLFDELKSEAKYKAEFSLRQSLSMVVNFGDDTKFAINSYLLLDKL